MTALPCSGVKNGVGSRHAYLSGKARTVLCFSCMKQIFSHARVTTSRGPQCLYYRRPEQRWRATTPLLPMPPNPTRPQVRRHGLGERATARRSTLPQGPHQGSAATATAAAYDAADADAADAADSGCGSGRDSCRRPGTFATRSGNSSNTRDKSSSCRRRRRCQQGRDRRTGCRGGRYVGAQNTSGGGAVGAPWRRGDRCGRSSREDRGESPRDGGCQVRWS